MRVLPLQQSGPEQFAYGQSHLSAESRGQGRRRGGDGRGGLLVGSWVNVGLYTLEVALYMFYMPQWSLTRPFKLGFAFVLANDALGTICVCANLFKTLVDGELKPMWPLTVLLISTALSAGIEQTYLIHRYWKVYASSSLLTLSSPFPRSKNILFIGVLLLLTVGQALLTVTAVGRGEISRLTTDQWNLADDVLIALAMVWTLSGINPVWRSTQHLIRAVCINALTSGAVVATVTILAVLPMLLHGRDLFEKQSIAVLGIFFAVMGRVYSLTVIVNFIHRRAQYHAHAFANSLQMPTPSDNVVVGSRPVSVVVGSFLLRSDGVAESEHGNPVQTGIESQGNGAEDTVSVAVDGTSIEDKMRTTQSVDNNFNRSFPAKTLSDKASRLVDYSVTSHRDISPLLLPTRRLRQNPRMMQDMTAAQLKHTIDQLHIAAANIGNANPYQKLTWASSAPTRTGSAAPQRQTRARTARTGSSTPLLPQQQPQLPPQFPPPQLPLLRPPQNPIPTRTQAYYSTYSSRMRTGSTLLMQPIIAPPQAAFGGSTMRTSRRGVAINYADPGSGDDMPDAGAAVDSEDSDFVNDNGIRVPSTSGRLKAARARMATGMSVFNSTTGVTTVQPTPLPQPKPDKGELDQSYLGMVPPARFVTSRPMGMTGHSYLPPHWIENGATRSSAPVPIRVELETETYRIRDCFIWNSNESLIQPEGFARVFCADLDLPLDMIDTVANQIKAQLEEHETIARLDIINEDFDQMEGEELAECRVILSIDVQIGNHHLVDHIEWDLLSPLTPEAFATTLCRELGLTGEAIPLVSHAVHEEILKHKKDCVEWGVVDGGGFALRDKTGLGLGSVGRARGGPKVLESVWRDWQEADELRTRFEILSAEEVERREVERERASRRMRRETSKFQSARTTRRTRW
ncbi:hypothetical protein C8F01DRAFT_1078055 [Mycena amicta]|nr:hypothetical protein C8F01DRAFT_1078055 [Mycena amicta]